MQVLTRFYVALIHCIEDFFFSQFGNDYIGYILEVFLEDIRNPQKGINNSI